MSNINDVEKNPIIIYFKKRAYYGKNPILSSFVLEKTSTPATFVKILLKSEYIWRTTSKIFINSIAFAPSAPIFVTH